MVDERKVLIIGAGPAGACLAQICRNNNIPFEIFEREDDLQARGGGAFMIDSALPGLDEFMPKDMGDWQVASANGQSGIKDTLAMADSDSGDVHAILSGIPQNGRPGAIVAGRKAMRNWLLQNLNVQTGKRLKSYEQDVDGVTAHFTDGTSVRGSILVGADGANSAVRNQMLNNPEPELHTFVPICGDTILAGEELRRLRKISNAAIVAHGQQAHLALMQVPSDEVREGEAKWWYLVSFRSEEPAADTAWVRAASKKALFEKAMSTTKHMPKILTDVVRRGGVSGLWSPQIRFTQFVPPEQLPRGRVTLLGDAAHNTTPFKGMGANIGLRDACDLGKLLIDEKWETFGEIETILFKYEQMMLPRGRQTVLTSRESGMSGAFDAKKFEEDIAKKNLTVLPMKAPMRLGTPTQMPLHAPSEMISQMVETH